MGHTDFVESKLRPEHKNAACILNLSCVLLNLILSGAKL